MCGRGRSMERESSDCTHLIISTYLVCTSRLFCRIGLCISGRRESAVKTFFFFTWRSLWHSFSVRKASHTAAACPTTVMGRKRAGDAVEQLPNNTASVECEGCIYITILISLLVRWRKDNLHPSGLETWTGFLTTRNWCLWGLLAGVFKWVSFQRRELHQTHWWRNCRGENRLHRHHPRRETSQMEGGDSHGTVQKTAA